MQPDYGQKINDLLEQYNVLGGLQGGQKLAIDNSSGKLAVSFGSNASWGGIQGVSRWLGSQTGRYNTKFEEIIDKITQINKECQESISYYEGHPEEVNHEQMLKMKIALDNAKHGLGELKEGTYSSDEERKKSINEQISCLSQIALKVADLKLSEQGEDDEDDWSILRDEGRASQPDAPVTEDAKSYSAQAYEYLYKKFLQTGSKAEKPHDYLLRIDYRLFTEPKLLLQSQASPDRSKAGGLLDGWEKISSDTERSDKFFVNLNKKVFDYSRGRVLFSKLTGYGIEAQFIHNLDVYKAKINELLGSIEKEHAKLSQQDQKAIIAVVTDLITVAMFPLSSLDGYSRQIVPLQTLFSCLQRMAIDPKTFIEERSWEIQELINYDLPIASNLHVVSLFNFADAALVKSMTNTPLFRAVYSSKFLKTFILHSNIYTPQLYRQTCRGAVHNFLFQQYCSTIAEMLVVTRSLMNQINEKLQSMTKMTMDEPAFEVAYGTAVTKGVYVKTILDESETKVEELEAKVISLANATQIKTAEVENLTREWNFIMQELETIMDPDKPRIFDKQSVPNLYVLSAAINVIKSQSAQLLPGQPLVAARWFSLDNQKLYEIGSKCFGIPHKSFVYQNDNMEPDQNNPLANLKPQDIEPIKIWELLYEKAGGMLEFIFLGGAATSTGHAVFVKAVLLQRTPVIEIWDPMIGSKKMLSIENFRKLIIDNFALEDQGRKTTNHMFVY